MPGAGGPEPPAPGFRRRHRVAPPAPPGPPPPV